MLIEGGQSQNTQSGRSFTREYALMKRGLVSPPDMPSTKGSQEGDPLPEGLPLNDPLPDETVLNIIAKTHWKMFFN